MYDKEGIVYGEIAVGSMISGYSDLADCWKSALSNTIITPIAALG